MADDNEQQRRIIRELRDYFQGDFSGDLAKAVAALPNEAKKFHTDALKTLEEAVTHLDDLRKTLRGLDRVAQTMASNNGEVLDALERIEQAIHDNGGVGGGGGGGPPVTAASPGPPGDVPGPDGSLDRPYWVEFTERSVRDLADALHTKLSQNDVLAGMGGIGGGAEKGAEPRKGGGVADQAQDAMFKNLAVEVDSYQRLAEVLHGRYDKKKKMVVDTIPERMRDNSRSFISRKLGEVFVNAIEYATDVISGKRALEKLKFYADKSFGDATKSFTSFADSIVNDFSYIFGQSGILAEHAIKLMEDMKSQGFNSFAFQGGDINKFGADIRRMRISMEETRNGQASLFRYFTHGEQNVIFGAMYDQMIGAGITDGLNQQKMIEYTSAQYEVMRQIATMTGQSLDELMLANKKDPTWTEALARMTDMGASKEDLARLEGLYEVLKTTSPETADMLVQGMMKSPSTAHLAYKGNTGAYADGRAIVLDEIIRGTISGGGPNSLDGLIDQFTSGVNTDLAGTLEGVLYKSQLNDTKALKNKEEPNKIVEELWNKFTGGLDNSAMKPLLDVASGLFGLVGSMQALTMAVTANTFAQLSNKAGGKFGEWLWRLTGGGPKDFMGAMGQVGLLASKITAVAGAFAGAIDVVGAFFGEERDYFKKAFVDVADDGERAAKQQTAQMSSGFIRMATLVLGFFGPAGWIAAGLLNVGDFIVSAFNDGGGLFDIAGVFIASISDGFMAWVKSAGEWIEGSRIDFFGTAEEKAAKAARNAARAPGASYVTPQTSIAANQDTSKQLAETAAAQNRVSVAQASSNSGMQQSLDVIAANTGAGANASSATAKGVNDLRSPAYRTEGLTNR